MTLSACQDNNARLNALRRYHILDTPREAAFDDITRLIAHICGTSVALISFVDEQRQWFKAETGLGRSETSLELSICRYAILQSDLFVVPDTLADPRFAQNPLVTEEPFLRFYAGAPLITSDGFILGTLCVLDQQPRELDDFQREALKVLAHQVVLLLELFRANSLQGEMLTELNAAKDKMERLATTDSLTGLLNRRAFNRRLEEEHALILRRHTPACLAMIDIDHFKRINDSYGHLVGDDALIFFAQLCREVFRSSDLICRWGGEEFIVLLHDQSKTAALAAVARLHQQLARAPLPNQEPPLLMTVSVGLAEMSATKSIETTLQDLDRALYAAKSEGRNQTRVVD